MTRKTKKAHTRRRARRASARSASTNDAIELIKHDHREVIGLFARFNAASSVAAREKLAHRIVRELSIHATIEEEILYPALRKAGIAEEVLKALEAHHAAKLLLLEISKLDPESDRFVAKMEVLQDSALLHIREEEEVLLPQLSRLSSATERESMGRQLAEAKKAAPTRPHPGAPDQPPGNVLAGIPAALYDRLKDAARELVE